MLGRRIAADAAAKGDLVERIDPLRLAAALPALRGQTVVVTGRIDGKLLHFQVPAGPDRSLILDDLTQAAAAADVNLVILETPSGRQPGSRNWLWLKAEVQGADGFHPDSGLDGLLSALASPGRPLAVRLVGTGERRTELLAVPVAGGEGGAFGGIGDALSRAASDLAGSVTGRIEPAAIRMHLVSLDRGRELDRRLVSWLPAWATWGYLGLLVLGATRIAGVVALVGEAVAGRGGVGLSERARAESRPRRPPRRLPAAVHAGGGGCGGVDGGVGTGRARHVKFTWRHERIIIKCCAN